MTRARAGSASRSSGKLNAKDYVCEDCFRDPVLREHVRENGERGNCTWCGARGAPRVHIKELTQAFRDVADYYVPTVDIDAGEFIEWRFQEDWDVFGDEIADSAERSRELILRIVEHGYHPKDDVDVDLGAYSGLLRHPESWLLDRWIEDAVANLVDPPERCTRDQPVLESIEVPIASDSREAHEHDGVDGGLLERAEAPEFDYDHLDLAFEDLATSIDADTALYRAQIHEYGGPAERFNTQRLGAPPPEKARSSRASRTGHPVLYTASDVATAVAEQRGWKGAAVAIAEIRPVGSLSLVDLRHPNNFSPFFIENLEWRVALRELLWRLAEDMAYPVDPRATDEVRDRLYRPTQYLCERIAAAGYDGVIHASAAGPGHNLVFFDPARCTVGDPRYLRVKEMLPALEDMSPYDDLYERRPYDSDADSL